jgi:hyperosmotically inducible protein
MTACAQTDAGVTTNVKTRLAADDLVKARQIDVDTRDRVVTLSGEVQSAAEETRALEIAKATRGVTSVIDRLSVAPEPVPTAGRVPTSETLDRTDPGITAEIKTKLLADPFVSGLKIDVDTKDRVVTLKGTVGSQAEKDRALAIARETERIVKVDDQLTVRRR